MKIKILILASMFGRDGTSRFITYFANSMSKRKDFNISILFFRDVDSILLSRLDSEVDVTCLSLHGGLWMSSYAIIKKIIEIRPNYCILGFHQLLLIGFLSPLFRLWGIKLLIRDTIIPSLFHNGVGIIKRNLFKLAYRQFYTIFAQSRDMREDLVKNWGVDFKKVHLINNPVDVKYFKNFSYQCPEELIDKKVFTFVAAGRLSYQKGYDIIINRIYEMKDRVSFRLIILGSGELEKQLNEQIVAKGLDKIITLAGYRSEVASYLYYADALLLSSRYEGFPNIVLEAQSIGKPVFANKCLGGINEIIINGENGWSCNFENKESFQEGLLKFFQCDFSAALIQKQTTERYDINVIMDKYIEVLK